LTITTALTLRAVFRLALRQIEGLIASLLRPLGLDLAAPNHSRPRPGVMLLVSSRWMSSATIDSPVETAQIPATILAALGLIPKS
jgi:Transposase DDE domain